MGRMAAHHGCVTSGPQARVWHSCSRDLIGLQLLDCNQQVACYITFSDGMKILNMSTFWDLLELSSLTNIANAHFNNQFGDLWQNR